MSIKERLRETRGYSFLHLEYDAVVHIEALEARIRELEPDAARYRWTRDKGCNFVWAEIGAGNCLRGLDEAIDAAIAKEKA